MMIYEPYQKPPSYKSYKNEQFNKKLEKARQLKISINDNSLLPEDKTKLKKAIAEIFSNSL